MLMPGTGLTAVGSLRPRERVRFIERPYRQPTHRFVEAGALAWLRGLDSVPVEPGWVASLELCSLVTGQVSALARRRRLRQAVMVWANDPRLPLYRLPLYRQAMRRARDADLFICFVEAAREHCVALGLPPERCRVVLPGVDAELYRPAAAPVAEPVALFASPLAGNKGIDRVLEAHRLVRRRLPDARLEVLGRGPLEGMVRREGERPAGGDDRLRLQPRGRAPAERARSRRRRGAGRGAARLPRRPREAGERRRRQPSRRAGAPRAAPPVRAPWRGLPGALVLRPRHEHSHLPRRHGHRLRPLRCRA